MNPDSSDLRYIMEKILILDFGSQYTQLIARRVRELSVYCEIHPFNKIPALDASVRGVILSGSPFSVRDENAPTPDLSAIKGKLPLLGVCYGAQFLASAFGGEVQPAPSREYGRAMLTVGDADDALMRGLPKTTQVWMSHGDTITSVPANYKIVASTEDVRVAAFHVEGEQTWGIQFHPEVYHSTDGMQLLKNFVAGICGCKQEWTSESFVEATVRELREKLGDDKVVLGLSGGVDSSVAAWLLKEQGHEVVGLFMINWHDTTGTLEGDCPWHDDRVFAELVAKRLDIPLRVVDLSADYRTRVVDYMFAEYEKGRTPNPDVLCNREIKFDVFLREALKLGADFVATGHYCRKAEEFLPDGRTVFKLLAGADPNKDQSYFLCQLSQEQLRYALFPIGDLLKPEVRRIAAEQGLATAKRKDSQGICFVGKVDLPAFLQQKLASKKGNVHEILPSWPKYNRALAAAPAKVENAAGPDTSDSRTNSALSTENRAIPAEADAEVARTDGEPSTERLTALAAPWRYTVRDGKKIGEHNGAHFYTIGQRKGLGIGGRRESLFILATDTAQNVIYVGEGDAHPGLWRPALHIAPGEIHWVNPARALSPGQSARFSIRIRYRQPLQDATLFMRDQGAYILFDQPQRGITPGQFAAWYDGDELVGSGVISE